MALTKSFLLELGVESGMASAIMAEHGKMQTGYLKQIEDLEAKSTADAAKASTDITALKKSYEDKITALTNSNKDAETKYEAELKTLKMEHRTSALLDTAKPFDKELVASLLNVDDLDVSLDTFDADYNARVSKLKEDKPFLFDTGDAKASVNEDEKSASKRTGFIPAKNTNEGAPIATFSRVGTELYPNISNILDFSD